MYECNSRLFTYTADSGMGGTLDTLTPPSGSGDLLAGSMGWPMLESGGCCHRFHDVSHFHPFVHAQCDSLLCWLRVLLVVRKEPSSKVHTAECSRH